MKQKMSKWLIIFMIPLFVMTTVGTVPAGAVKNELDVYANGAILIDADTGKILYEQNADTPMGLASMSKMMALYILLESIAEGKITWDQEYKVTDYTYAISQDTRLSNVPLRKDGVYTIEELYEALLIYSGNAATIGIVETIAGSEAKFVEMMYETAEKLGLKDSKIVNATGLNNSFLQGRHLEGTSVNDENEMTPKSVAKLAYHIINDYPEVLETTKIKTKTFREGTSDRIEMENWNLMLPGAIYEYEGVDGLKTGTTDFAGQCFTATATRGDKRLIAVVMNAVNAKGEASNDARFTAARTLLDYGFEQFSEVELVPAGYDFGEQGLIPVRKGASVATNIALKEPMKMLIKTSEQDLYKPELVLDESKLKDGQFDAPIKKDTVVGQVKLVRTAGEDLGFIYGEPVVGEAVVKETVEKASSFTLTMQSVGEFTVDTWNRIVVFVKGLF